MRVAPSLPSFDPSQHIDLFDLLCKGLLAEEISFVVGEVLEVKQVMLLDPRLDAERFGELIFVGKGGLVRLTHRFQLSIMMMTKDIDHIIISSISTLNHSQANFLSKELMASAKACRIEKGYRTSKLNNSLPNLPKRTRGMAYYPSS